jgi:AcrR family transcriptional regulator
MTTKEKIIDVSIDLFSKSGYNGVSIRDITKIVGIRESSLYKHFKNKEELLNTIFNIFLDAYNQKNLSEVELKEKLQEIDLIVFLKTGIEIFLHDMETPTLKKIFRILMNEQFRIEKARNIITNELITMPTKLYSNVFMSKLNINLSESKLLAREYHYPLFTMAYEYSIKSFDNTLISEIKEQMFDHIDFFYANILKEKELN